VKISDEVIDMPRHRRGWAATQYPDNQYRHSSLMVSMLEPALLILIKEQPRHGYTLLSDLNRMGFNAIHPSVVYRILRDMEALAWIQSDWNIDQTQGPPRRIYRITENGQEALLYWQNEMKRTHDLIESLINQ
jgi:PadR family transcriptional regulator PadR